MKKHLLISLRMTVVFSLITCGLYPLVVFAIGQAAFRHQSNGSMIERNGRAVGSALVGQSFTASRFFHSRPSASDFDATASGGTNLGPTSKKLRDAIALAVKAFDVQTNVPADAVTSSASGLDPHISPANAYAQAPRVARVNGLLLTRVRSIIASNTEQRFLGLFGEPRVNVLRLNLTIAEATRR